MFNVSKKPFCKTVSEQSILAVCFAKIRTPLGTSPNALFQSRPICHVMKKKEHCKTLVNKLYINLSPKYHDYLTTYTH